MTNERKSDMHKLWWNNPVTEEMHPAGVAFYDEKYAEYRLKIDFFPSNQYYLRLMGSSDEEILYRAEVVIKKDGKFQNRKMIGSGYSQLENPDVIQVDLAPFDRILVLDLNKGEE